MHDDLVAVARMCDNREAEKLLRAAKRNFLRGITLTILIQTIGRPGWVKNASIEFFAKPAPISRAVRVRAAVPGRLEASECAVARAV